MVAEMNSPRSVLCLVCTFWYTALHPLSHGTFPLVSLPTTCPAALEYPLWYRLYKSGLSVHVPWIIRVFIISVIRLYRLPYLVILVPLYLIVLPGIRLFRMFIHIYWAWIRLSNCMFFVHASVPHSSAAYAKRLAILIVNVLLFSFFLDVTILIISLNTLLTIFNFFVIYI